MSALTSLKTPLSYLALSSALLSPVVAVSAESPDNRYFSQRWYVGAGISGSRLDPALTTDALSITDTRGQGFKLNVGYDLSPRISLDAYAGTLGEADLSFLGTAVGGVGYDVYGLSLVAYVFSAGSPYSDSYDDDGLYQREGLSSYVRVGLGGMRNDSNDVEYDLDHRAHVAAGLGMEYGWSNGHALRAELTSYDTDARELSLSVLKRFGEGSYATAAAASVLPDIVATAPEPEAQAVAEALEQGKRIVLFAFDSIDVRSDYEATLKGLAQVLQNNPEIRVQIDGHSDWVGEKSYNMMLSNRRAISVRDYLINRGVAPQQLTAKGYGEQNPVADNKTAFGRSRNRRVEITRGL